MISQKGLPGNGHKYTAHKAIHYLQGGPKGLQKLVDRLYQRELSDFKKSRMISYFPSPRSQTNLNKDVQNITYPQFVCLDGINLVP